MPEPIFGKGLHWIKNQCRFIQLLSNLRETYDAPAQRIGVARSKNLGPLDRFQFGPQQSCLHLNPQAVDLSCGADLLVRQGKSWKTNPTKAGLIPRARAGRTPEGSSLRTIKTQRARSWIRTGRRLTRLLALRVRQVSEWTEKKDKSWQR